MKLFEKNKEKTNTKFLIYLVEDNKIYARELEFYLKSKFGEKIVLNYFPVAEVAEDKIESGEIPDLIIMDHFLNVKYEDAEDGFFALRRLNRKHPDIHLILHSSMENKNLSLKIIDKNICSYIAKGADGFKKLEDEIKILLN